MILNKSWWDTVDFIAAKLTGEYFKNFPEQINKTTEKWIFSYTIWLKRAAILFQLQYKNETDTEILSSVINSLTWTKEFFINKAIGWILCQYGKTNPFWVKNFTEKTIIIATKFVLKYFTTQNKLFIRKTFKPLLLLSTY